MPTPEEGSALADKTDAVVAKSAPAADGGTVATALVVRPAAAGATTSKPARRRWLWAAGTVLVAGLAGLAFFQPWAASVSVVSVETVALGPVARVLAVNGRIAGVRSVDVRPLVGGRLAEVLVDEGDLVQAKAVLARVDPAAQQAVVRQAMAGLDAALVAETEAQAVYTRTDALGTNAARVVLESAARAVLTAAQQVAQMTAVLDQAEIQLDKLTIRAPLAGTVLVRAVEVGQIVDPATVLMTIADLGQLVVETDVDESYATQIKVGQPAALQLSGEGVVRAGRVSFVSQRVDETTGGLAVKVTPDAALTAPIGLTVTTNITVDDRAAAMTVPRAAIVRDGAGDAVLVILDGKAQRRVISVIDWPTARLIVTDGLAVGDVVIRDATGLVDGQAVAVAN